uniref:Uncharacterized protein n=1 Tax=Romanomermis culicivorax TaxID=13658 RepID=A0A915KPY7_ROMCU
MEYQLACQAVAHQLMDHMAVLLEHRTVAHQLVDHTEVRLACQVVAHQVMDHMAVLQEHQTVAHLPVDHMVVVHQAILFKYLSQSNSIGMDICAVGSSFCGRSSPKEVHRLMSNFEHFGRKSLLLSFDVAMLQVDGFSMIKCDKYEINKYEKTFLRAVELFEEK